MFLIRGVEVFFRLSRLFQPFKTLCFLNYALMTRHDYDLTSPLRRGVIQKEYLSIRPATCEKEMELWVELKRMYEPDPEDQLWTLTQNFMHAPVEWKLYDLSGVHHLTAKDREIFMLVEKDYPFKKGLALVMISYKLQYKFPLPVKIVTTTTRKEMPLPEVCTAIEEMKKKQPVKDKWQLH
nr:hypothetical protein [Tanacetum cinerariifolium]